MYDLARISANGTTEPTTCNLYFTMDSIPYSMYTEWDQPWQAEGDTVKLTLFTRFNNWESWREVWTVQGEQSNGFHQRGDTTSMVRLLLENPDKQRVHFHLTLKPVYG